MSSIPKERCKYWADCYRKNKDHLDQYLHPSDRTESNSAAGQASSCSRNAPVKSENISRKERNSTSNRKSSCDSKPSSGTFLTPKSSTYGQSPAKSSSHGTDLSSSSLECGRARVSDNSKLHSATKSMTVNSMGVGCSTSPSVKRTLISGEIKEELNSCSTQSGNRKRRKLTGTLKHDRYYFTKVVGHPDKFSEDIALSFRDIFSLDGKVTKTWQFTYMVDLDWLLEEYPDNAAEGPIFLFLGEKQAKEAQDQIMLQKKTTSQPKKYSRIIVVPVSLPLTYGTHHTKLMILQSEGGARVVIHTANLVMVDWTVKTQGVWISPLCPLLPEGQQQGQQQVQQQGQQGQQEGQQEGQQGQQGQQEDDTDDADCLHFKSYLLKYLSAYNTPATDQLIRILRKYDMSGVTQVKLVGSVPGLHTAPLYGTPRLRRLLSRFVDDSKVRPGWRIVANCSSIGSLGATTAEWFDKFTRALQTTNRGEESGRKALCQLVFPTVEMIRNSLEGYCGGGSVPYQLRTHRRQPWLRAHLCHWESREYGRSRVVPHIKTYTRLSPDMTRVAWFLLTSANLSKAAWGQELGDGRVRVRSYELGVLFVSPEPGKVYSREERCGMLVPYSLPPRPYSKTDKPWVADISYSQLDTHGNKWPIDTTNLLEME